MNGTIGTAPVAGLGRRAAAVLVDGVLALLAGGWLVVLASLREVQGATTETDAASVPPWLLALCTAALLALSLTQWVLHGRLGWTLGRRLLGVRTVDERTRRPIGMVRVLVRGLVVAAGALVLGVGQYVVLLSPLFDRAGRRQGWHDKAAHDLVLDVRGVGAPVAPPPPRPEVARAATAISFRGSPAGAPAPPPPPPASLAPPPPPSVPAPPRTAGPATAPLVLAPLAPHRAGPDLDTRALPLVPPPPPRPVPPPPSSGAVRPSPAVASSSVPVAPPVAGRPVAAEDDEDVETTRRRVSEPPARRAAGPLTGAVLTLSDGQRIVVERTALVGRNPAAATDGVQLVRVVDPGRSVSKTHLQIAVEPSGVWVADRGSTNGTVVTLPDGGQVICPVDHPVRLRVGAVVVFGDCSLRLVETTTREVGAGIV